MSAVTFTVDRMTVLVFDDPTQLAKAAAADAAATISGAIEAHGTANVMFATGISQLAFLAVLTDHDLDWSRVVAFHMDEYIGLGAEHPESFVRYLSERVDRVVHPKMFHFLDGAATDPDAEADRYAAVLREHSLHLCVLGIGENGHLAFNDPPVADFDDPCDVKVVELDDTCKRQQVGEGHFPNVAAVPPRAITVTIPALLRAGMLVAIVPGERKAAPVRAALEGPVSTACPASILRTQPQARLYLDRGSAGSIVEAP